MPLYGLLTCVCSRKRARRDGAAVRAGSGVAGVLTGLVGGAPIFSCGVEVIGSWILGWVMVSAVEREEKGFCSGFGEEVTVVVEVESVRVWLVYC